VVPASGVIQLTDYGYRAWGPELVQYRLDLAQFPPGNQVLLGPDGKAVPFQIKVGVLSFVAELPKGQTVQYKLQRADADRSRENSRLSVNKAGEFLEIANERVAIRVPAPQEKKLPEPAAAATVPAPLAGFKQQGHGWIGGSHFETPRKISSYQLRIVEEGPASITYEARYRFAPAGEYVWRVQLDNGLAYAVITEEFDFAAMTDGHDFLVLDLATGWTPDSYRYMFSGFGGGGSPLLTGGIETSGLASYVSKKTTEWKNWPASGPPKPPQPGNSSMVLLDRMNQTGSFGARSAIGLSSSDRAAYILPMHGGAWRRSMSITAWNDPGSGVKVAFPIIAFRKSNVTHA